jgi:hypothetical protein
MTTNTDFDRAYDYICANRLSNSFMKSLFDQFQRKGGLSEKQILAVLRTIDAPKTVDKSEPADPVTEVGMYRNADGIFRVKQSRESKNLYAMRFVPTGTTKSERFVYERGGIYRLSASDRMTVEQCAELGVAYSMCIICGADLTDPKSIARGMGSTCAGKV